VSDDRHWTVVIDVVAVAVMEPAGVQVINVVAMRDSLVVAVAIVATITVGLLTIARIGVTYGDRMLIVMAAVLAVQAAVMDIVDVALMLKARVAAGLAVNVVVIAVNIVLHGENLLSRHALRMCRGATYRFLIVALVAAA
jgi:hypothetical protein